MIAVPITEKIKAIAEWTASMRQRKHTRGGNYTKLEAPQAYYHGAIGELCLYTLMKQSNTKSDYALNITGHADNGDFLIWGKGKPYRADIKTASKPFHTRIMITKSQYNIHKCDLYIGARLNDEICEVWGYNKGIDGTTVEDKGVPSYNRNLTALTPIERLILNAERGFAGWKIEGEISEPTFYKLQSWFNQ